MAEKVAGIVKCYHKPNGYTLITPTEPSFFSRWQAFGGVQINPADMKREKAKKNNKNVYIVLWGNTMPITIRILNCDTLFREIKVKNGTVLNALSTWPPSCRLPVCSLCNHNLNVFKLTTDV